MKKTLLALATVITTAAAGTSLYIATLTNPTEMQKQLGTTANTIVATGATAIFGVLNDQDGDNQKPDDENS